MSESRCWAGLGARHSARHAMFHHDQCLPPGEDSLLAYGNGRSYGDVCLNPGHGLLLTQPLDRFLAFDRDTGILRCEAGLQLGDLLATTLAQGWFLPVVPGTRFVTVGGAVANDVHGKNHTAAGSFGRHVRALTLRRSDGSQARLTAADPLFRASVGGLGLTGLIVEVELALRRVSGPWMQQRAQVFADLDEGINRLQQASDTHEHAAAWIDVQGDRRRRGRGLLLAADHAEGEGDASVLARPSRLGLAGLPRLPLVNALSVRAFNVLYFAQAQRRPVNARVHCRPFLFLLDALADWNRLYGRRGLRQYQCVLPPTSARAALHALLEAVVASDQVCALAVLKRFGEHAAAGMLSFPRPGLTLSLDFPFRAQSTLDLFARLDAIVVAADGALYPAKDAHMSAAMFRRGYPGVDAFAVHVDPRFSSGFWRRVCG